jgi:hypothetical protein
LLFLFYSLHIYCFLIYLLSQGSPVDRTASSGAIIIDDLCIFGEWKKIWVHTSE